jgi:hypothetical protein
MQRALITQTSVENVKFVLNEAAENLAAHANASLSKAHSINLAEGFVDDSGEDRTQYRDDHSNVISDHQVQFTIDNTIYYAPALNTALSGNTPSGGRIDFPVTNDVLANKHAAWVTDFTAEQVDFVQSVDNTLLAHTQQGHWEVHGGMTVVPSVTLDSKGYIVGRFLAQFSANGAVYSIPCDTRIGGPPQMVQFPVNNGLPTALFSSTPGIFGFFGTTLRMDCNVDSNFPATVTFTFSGITGSAPVTWKWQWSVSGGEGTWNDVVANTSFPIAYGYKSFTGLTGTVAGGIAQTVFKIVAFGGNSALTWYMRAVFTNDTGDYPATVFFCHMHHEVS